MMKLSLGEFGLKYCDLPTMLSNVALFLRYITINIDKNNSKRIPFVCYVLLVTAAVCYVYIYIFSMFWFVFVRCRETGDFTAAAVVLSLGVIIETSITKFIAMMIYKERLRDLVKRYLECDSKVQPGTRFYDNIQKKLFNVKRRAMLIWAFFITTGVSYAVLPLLLPGRHLSEDLFVIYGLEPMFESPNYEIILVSETLTILMCNYIIANVTAFIIIIIGYIEAHVFALSDEIMSAWNDAEILHSQTNKHILIISTIRKNEMKMKYINKQVADRLKQVIGFHTTVIKLVKDFEGLFRVTMALEFMFLIIGIVTELLGQIENTFIELPDTFIQLFIICFIGQKLIDAGNNFESAVYNCKWENFDKRNMRMILLILQNAQKSLHITAGGLANLDFVCLMSIIKSTYSLYTTLESKSKNK